MNTLIVRYLLFKSSQQHVVGGRRRSGLSSLFDHFCGDSDQTRHLWGQQEINDIFTAYLKSSFVSNWKLDTISVFFAEHYKLYVSI